jgi:hypothetical protein
LIRDRVISNVRDVAGMGESGPQLESGMRDYPWDEVFEAFRSLGLITLSAQGDVAPTERIEEIQDALGLSLTRLAAYDHNAVVSAPIFGRPSKLTRNIDILVLMPFSEELRPVYAEHILNVATKLGLTASRVDDFFDVNSVISDIWNAINCAKIIIADCTGRNPNVFYELGIAHTLGKRVILIAQQKEKNDIPFDIQHIRALFYEFTPRGMRNFESYLEIWLLSELNQTRTLSEYFDNKKRI